MHSLPIHDGAGGPEPTGSSPLSRIPTWATGLSADLAGPCTLRDGVIVMVRPIRDEDMPRIQAFHLGLSYQTLYLRFGHLLAGFPDTLATWLTCVDGDRRMAFVATTTTGDAADVTGAAKGVPPQAQTDTLSPEQEQIIAVARYEHVRAHVAEMAAVVADRWQGRGLGPLVLYRLALYACRHGYTTLIGYLRGTNDHAVRALLHGALPYSLKPLDEDTLLVTLDIAPMGVPE